jgi:hypothetical protein
MCKVAVPSLAIVVSLALTGCYPALRATQPHARFSVQDTDKHPIEGATIMLATWRGWYGRQTVEEYRTDAAGKFLLPSKHSWEWQIMLPDGRSWYEFSYCIEKPGYRAISEPRPNFRKRLTIVMERTNKHSACAWPDEAGPARVIEE